MVRQLVGSRRAANPANETEPMELPGETTVWYCAVFEALLKVTLRHNPILENPEMTKTNFCKVYF